MNFETNTFTKGIQVGPVVDMMVKNFNLNTIPENEVASDIPTVDVGMDDDMLSFIDGEGLVDDDDDFEHLNEGKQHQFSDSDMSNSDVDYAELFKDHRADLEIEGEDEIIQRYDEQAPIVVAKPLHRKRLCYSVPFIEFIQIFAIQTCFIWMNAYHPVATHEPFVVGHNKKVALEDWKKLFTMKESQHFCRSEQADVDKGFPVSHYLISTGGDGKPRMAYWNVEKIPGRLACLLPGLTAETVPITMEFAFFASLHPDVKLQVEMNQLVEGISALVSPDALVLTIATRRFWAHKYRKVGLDLPDGLQEQFVRFFKTNNIPEVLWDSFPVPCLVVYDLTTSIAKNQLAGGDKHKIKKLTGTLNKYTQLSIELHDLTGLPSIVAFETIAMHTSTNYTDYLRKTPEASLTAPYLLFGLLPQTIITQVSAMLREVAKYNTFYDGLSATLNKHMCSSCGRILSKENGDSPHFMLCKDHAHYFAQQILPAKQNVPWPHEDSFSLGMPVSKEHLLLSATKSMTTIIGDSFKARKTSVLATLQRNLCLFDERKREMAEQTFNLPVVASVLNHEVTFGDELKQLTESQNLSTATTKSLTIDTTLARPKYRLGLPDMFLNVVQVLFLFTCWLSPVAPQMPHSIYEKRGLDNFMSSYHKDINAQLGSSCTFSNSAGLSAWVPRSLVEPWVGYLQSCGVKGSMIGHMNKQHRKSKLSAEGNQPDQLDIGEGAQEQLKSFLGPSGKKSKLPNDPARLLNLFEPENKLENGVSGAWSIETNEQEGDHVMLSLSWPVYKLLTIKLFSSGHCRVASEQIDNEEALKANLQEAAKTQFLVLPNILYTLLVGGDLIKLFQQLYMFNLLTSGQAKNYTIAMLDSHYAWFSTTGDMIFNSHSSYVGFPIKTTKTGKRLCPQGYQAFNGASYNFKFLTGDKVESKLKPHCLDNQAIKTSHGQFFSRMHPIWQPLKVISIGQNQEQLHSAKFKLESTKTFDTQQYISTAFRTWIKSIFIQVPDQLGEPDQSERVDMACKTINALAELDARGPVKHLKDQPLNALRQLASWSILTWLPISIPGTPTLTYSRMVQACSSTYVFVLWLKRLVKRKLDQKLTILEYYLEQKLGKTIVKTSSMVKVDGFCQRLMDKAFVKLNLVGQAKQVKEPHCQCETFVQHRGCVFLKFATCTVSSSLPGDATVILQAMKNWSKSQEEKLQSFASTLCEVSVNLAPARFILTHEKFLAIGMAHASKEINIVNIYTGQVVSLPKLTTLSGQLPQSKMELIQVLIDDYNKKLTVNCNLKEGLNVNQPAPRTITQQSLYKNYEERASVATILTNEFTMVKDIVMNIQSQAIAKQYSLNKDWLNVNAPLDMLHEYNEAQAPQYVLGVDSQPKDTKSSSKYVVPSLAEQHPLSILISNHDLKTFETIVSPLLRCFLLFVTMSTVQADDLLPGFLKWCMYTIMFMADKTPLGTLTNLRYRLFTQVTALGSYPVCDGSKQPNIQNMSNAGRVVSEMARLQMGLESWWQLLIQHPWMLTLLHNQYTNKPDLIKPNEAVNNQLTKVTGHQGNVLPCWSNVIDCIMHSIQKLKSMNCCLHKIGKTNLATLSSMKPVVSLNLKTFGSIDLYTLYQGVYGVMKRTMRPDDYLLGVAQAINDHDYTVFERNSDNSLNIKGDQKLLTRLGEEISSYRRIMPTSIAMEWTSDQANLLTKNERKASSICLTFGWLNQGFYVAPFHQIQAIINHFKVACNQTRYLIAINLPIHFPCQLSLFTDYFKCQDILQELPCVFDVLTTEVFDVKLVLTELLSVVKNPINALDAFATWWKPHAGKAGTISGVTKHLMPANNSNVKFDRTEVIQTALQVKAGHKHESGWASFPENFHLYLTFIGMCRVANFKRGILAFFSCLVSLQSSQLHYSKWLHGIQTDELNADQVIQGTLSLLLSNQSCNQFKVNDDSMEDVLATHKTAMQANPKLKAHGLRLCGLLRNPLSGCLILLQNPMLTLIYQMLVRKRQTPAQFPLKCSPESLTNGVFINMFHGSSRLEPTDQSWLAMARSFNHRVYNYLFMKNEYKQREITASNGCLRLGISALDKIFEVLSKSLVGDLTYKPQIKYNFVDHFQGLMGTQSSLVFNNGGFAPRHTSIFTTKYNSKPNSCLFSDVGFAWYEKYFAKHQLRPLNLLSEQPKLKRCMQDYNNRSLNSLLTLMVHTPAAIIQTTKARYIVVDSLRYRPLFVSKYIRSFNGIVGQTAQLMLIDLCELEPLKTLDSQTWPVKCVAPNLLELFGQVTTVPPKYLATNFPTRSDSYGIYPNSHNALSITQFNHGEVLTQPLIVNDDNLFNYITELESFKPTIAQRLTTQLSNGATRARRLSSLFAFMKDHFEHVDLKPILLSCFAVRVMSNSLTTVLDTYCTYKLAPQTKASNNKLSPPTIDDLTITELTVKQAKWGPRPVLYGNQTWDLKTGYWAFTDKVSATSCLEPLLFSIDKSLTDVKIMAQTFCGSCISIIEDIMNDMFENIRNQQGPLPTPQELMTSTSVVQTMFQLLNNNPSLNKHVKGSSAVNRSAPFCWQNSKSNIKSVLVSLSWMVELHWCQPQPLLMGKLIRKAYPFTSDFTRFNMSMPPLLLKMLRSCCATPNVRDLVDTVLESWHDKVFQIPEFYISTSYIEDLVSRLFGVGNVSMSNHYGYMTLKEAMGTKTNVKSTKSGQVWLPNIMSQGMFGSMSSSITALMMNIACQMLLELSEPDLVSLGCDKADIKTMWIAGGMCPVVGNTSDDGAGFFQLCFRNMSINGPKLLESNWRVFCALLNSFGLKMSLSKCLIFPNVGIMELNSKIAVFGTKDLNPRIMFNVPQVAISQGGKIANLPSILNHLQTKSFACLTYSGDRSLTCKLATIINGDQLAVLQFLSWPTITRSLFSFLNLATWTRSEWMAFTLGYPELHLQKMLAKAKSQIERLSALLYFLLYCDVASAFNTNSLCPVEVEQLPPQARFATKTLQGQLLASLMGAAQTGDLVRTIVSARVLAATSHGDDQFDDFSIQHGLASIRKTLLAGKVKIHQFTLNIDVFLHALVANYIVAEPEMLKVAQSVQLKRVDTQPRAISYTNNAPPRFATYVEPGDPLLSGMFTQLEQLLFTIFYTTVSLLAIHGDSFPFLSFLRALALAEQQISNRLRRASSIVILLCGEFFGLPLSSMFDVILTTLISPPPPHSLPIFSPLGKIKMADYMPPIVQSNELGELIMTVPNANNSGSRVDVYDWVSKWRSAINAILADQTSLVESSFDYPPLAPQLLFSTFQRIKNICLQVGTFRNLVSHVLQGNMTADITQFVKATGDFVLLKLDKPLVKLPSRKLGDAVVYDDIFDTLGSFKPSKWYVLTNQVVNAPTPARSIPDSMLDFKVSSTSSQSRFSGPLAISLRIPDSDAMVVFSGGGNTIFSVQLEVKKSPILSLLFHTAALWFKKYFRRITFGLQITTNESDNMEHLLGPKQTWQTKTIAYTKNKRQNYAFIACTQEAMQFLQMQNAYIVVCECYLSIVAIPRTIILNESRKQILFTSIIITCSEAVLPTYVIGDPLETMIEEPIDHELLVGPLMAGNHINEVRRQLEESRATFDRVSQAIHYTPLKKLNIFVPKNLSLASCVDHSYFLSILDMPKQVLSATTSYLTSYSGTIGLENLRDALRKRCWPADVEIKESNAPLHSLPGIGYVNGVEGIYD